MGRFWCSASFAKLLEMERLQYESGICADQHQRAEHGPSGCSHGAVRGGACLHGQVERQEYRAPGVAEDDEKYTFDPPTLKPIETGKRKGKLHVNGVDVSIYNEIVSYYDKGGKLVTESLKDFSKKSILNEYASLDDFLHKWNSTDRKQAILDELEQQGVLIDELRKDIGIDDIGDFDLILHIAYDKKPLTRYERVNNVIKKGYLYKYSEMAQNILKDLLEKYSDNNELELTDTKILELKPFNEYGSPMDIVDVFGGKDKYIEVVEELENELYAS